MVLKVRADVPLVWRSPSSLQFGVDRPLVVLDELDEGPERLVAALVSGISPSGLDMMARTVGLDERAAAELLEVLDPVLERASPPRDHRVTVTGSGPLADELRRLTAANGLLVAPDDGSPDLAVIVAGWLVAAEDHGRWLRRDIPHVPVLVGDTGVSVGPFVEPERGPCLYCVQLAMTDADPAWPAIATQLWSRPAPPLTALAVAEAAAFALRRILFRLETGPAGHGDPEFDARSWRIDAADGVISARGWTRHAACRCAAPPESDWAPVPDPANRSAPTTAAVGAALG